MSANRLLNHTHGLTVKAGILEVQELTEAQKVAILLGALSGEAKRQVDILDQGDRERAARIFIVLDALYVEKVPL